jgi:hypothetical protein
MARNRHDSHFSRKGARKMGTIDRRIVEGSSLTLAICFIGIVGLVSLNFLSVGLWLTTILTLALSWGLAGAMIEQQKVGKVILAFFTGTTFFTLCSGLFSVLMVQPQVWWGFITLFTVGSLISYGLIWIGMQKKGWLVRLSGTVELYVVAMIVTIAPFRWMAIYFARGTPINNLVNWMVGIAAVTVALIWIGRHAPRKADT